MVLKKMCTYERVIAAKRIITMLAMTLLSLIIIWGGGSLRAARAMAHHKKKVMNSTGL